MTQWERLAWRLGVLAVTLALVLGVGGILTNPRHERASGSVTPTAVIATAGGDQVRVYRHRGDDDPWKVLDNPNPQGAPLVFLVRDRHPRWLHVRMPVRPNGSVGWIRAGEVELSTTTYRADVSLPEQRIIVHHGDDVIMTAPVAVGKEQTPTPTGHYFVTSLLEPPNPHGAYGPYAFGLSAYSEVIFHFGGGPGQIGLHGTNRPELLGKSISHGCIRLSNKNIKALARRLPLGTPVTVHG